MNIRAITDLKSMLQYFSDKLDWGIELDDEYDVDDYTYEVFSEDLGIKKEEFAKIDSMAQLMPLVDDMPFGIFCVNFESRKLETAALKKILSKLITRNRNNEYMKQWDMHDLIFLCFWGDAKDRYIGVACYDDNNKSLPQLKIEYIQPQIEDFKIVEDFEAKLKKLRLPDDIDDKDKWRDQWRSAFTAVYRSQITDSKNLAEKLAGLAQHTRDTIISTYNVETALGYVHLLYEKFKSNLVHDLSVEQFADMYAQTIAYGLFSAKCMDDSEQFDWNDAVDRIPNTNPFLKSLIKSCFEHDSGKAFFDELELAEIINLLDNTNIGNILEHFNRHTGGGREDTVIYFYEDFLSAYEHETKKRRGVYYTPWPVVKFIVRAVNDILKTEFGFADGLADTATKTILKSVEGKKKRVSIDVPAIQILDPATGTGTFLREVILSVYETFKEKNKGKSDDEIKKLWNEYVPKHLLPRLNGFELMMAPYAVAHMKLAMVLKDTGYEFGSKQRLNVMLTNTLEPASSDADFTEECQQMSLFEDPLAAEAFEADKTKNNLAINVIIGNPPYSGESANKGEWIMDLTEDYKKEPGGREKLQEQNSKWINDDYVKFIRLSQLFLNRTEKGVLSFICPHGFIDNPTFRGMRWNLAKTYKKIYILDLHGNAKKRETAPDGTKDENVFDIQQGVCIMFMIYCSTGASNFAEIYHADLFGTRDNKYNLLNASALDSIKWTKVNSSVPFFLFKPTKVITDSKECFNVSEIFVNSTMGFQTHRDNLAISFTQKSMEEKIHDILTNSNLESIKTRFAIKDTSEWTISRAKSQLLQLKSDYRADKITKCQYRLFDIRYCFLDGILMDRPRLNVFYHVTNKENYVLGVGRQGLAVGDIEWCLATISHYAMDANIFRRGGVTAAPLYLYGNTMDNAKRTPNLKGAFVEKFAKSLGLTFTNEKTSEPTEFSPIDIIDYIYAILYSHKYRELFSDELKIDYPKIPYPSSSEYFWKLVNKGKELRNLHTMDITLATDNISFDGNGDTTVTKYTLKNERIYINNTQYFTTDSTLSDVWIYTIGGNQPLQKWLKDRKGLTLSADDIEHYKRIIAALKRTNELMEEIDEVFEF